MAANGISTLTIASGTTLTKNVNPPHTNAEIVPPYSAIWSLNYAGALGATNDVSYKLYVTSLGIGSAFTLTSHQTGDFAVTAGNFLYDEYGTSIGIIKGNTTIDNYMAKAAAVCGSLSSTIINAAIYKGTWNAFTNTPTLTDGVGTLGDAYDTTVAGTSGAYPAYGEQDWRIYDGSVWQRVAKTTTTQWTITPATGGLADKEARQLAKLDIAEAKRQGKVVAEDGTITGSVDDTKPYYRVRNTYDITQLPSLYDGYDVVDNANVGGLIEGRPWISVSPIVTSGLRLHLDAGNAASYSGSGTTWTDLSTNTNNATLVGSPVFTSAGTGSYFTFPNNSGKYATTPHTKYSGTYTGKTTFFVARMDAGIADGYHGIFGTNITGRTFNTYIYKLPGPVYQVHASFGSTPTNGWSDNLTLTAGQWFTFGATQAANGDMTFYFNGQAVGVTTELTFTNTYSSGTDTQLIGKADDGTLWHGDVAVATVYDRTLSGAEMLQNHNAIVGRYGL